MKSVEEISGARDRTRRIRAPATYVERLCFRPELVAVLGGEERKRSDAWQRTDGQLVESRGVCAVTTHLDETLPAIGNQAPSLVPHASDAAETRASIGISRDRYRYRNTSTPAP